MEQLWSVNDLTEFVAESVRNAREGGVPFYHLEFDRVFPSDFYAEMLRTMPDENDYRPMSGKSKVGSSRPDGKPTRTKIDLFPEYIRHLPPEKFAVWDVVGRVLRSNEVKAALIQHLAPGLKRRFGENFASVATFPATAFSSTPTVFGKESRFSFTCRPTIPIRISARFFTKNCRTGANRKERKCHSRQTPVMPLPSGMTPGIRRSRSDQR